MVYCQTASAETNYWKCEKQNRIENEISQSYRNTERNDKTTDYLE
jgi:hypothetical protein